MVTSAFVATSPSSSDIVDDIERRINTEINQLLNDIKRIEPTGLPWCTFGELFMDAAVQQYYEALVNTLKSAKRKGVIDFKGQLLLKGMHDNVVVKIVYNEKEDKQDNEVTKLVANDIVVSSTKNDNDHSTTATSLDQTTLIDNNDFSVDKQTQSTISSHKIRSTGSIGSLSSVVPYTRNLQSITEKDSTITGVEVETLQQQRPSPQQNNVCKSSSPSSSPTPSSLSNPNKEVTNSIIFFPTARAFSTSRSKSERSIIFQKQQTQNQHSDVAHIKGAGTTFHHHNSQNKTSIMEESHDDRIGREIKQLVEDIRRIEPSGEHFCTFGLLFDDPQVEQYYEALVGTLKAARRQGVITFTGQMLLKGMHDNVQIAIVE